MYQNSMFIGSRMTHRNSSRRSMQDAYTFQERYADDDVLIEDADSSFSVL